MRARAGGLSLKHHTILGSGLARFHREGAAVYCGDGRLGEPIDDFLHNALHLTRYDRQAVPVGAACLADHFATYREGDAVAAQLEFLINVHQLRRVVLIAHEGCAFYTDRLRISPIGVTEKQHSATSRVWAIRCNSRMICPLGNLAGR